MKLIKKNNKKGFTLVELVIVIAILAILALILVPAIGKYIGNANTSKMDASVRTIYTNSVLEQSLNPGHADLLKNITDASNIKTGDLIKVEIAKDGKVTKVTYTSDSKTVTFDGKDVGTAANLTTNEVVIAP